MTADNRTNEQLSGNTGQFTEAQVEAAALAMHRDTGPRGGYGWTEYLSQARAALEAAAGAAPQADSVERANLIGRLTGSVNPLSVTCGECGSRPGRRCYGNGEMRRPHPSRETKAERELMIEAAEALAATVQPSSTVDEETLANLIHSTSVAHFGGLDPRVAPIIARAVAEWLEWQGVCKY